MSHIRENGVTTARRRLADRRPCESFNIEVGAQRYVVSIGRFPDGTLAELFIGNGKAGSDSDAHAKEAAIAISIGLQYGVPLAVFRGALLRDSRGQASTPLGTALDVIAGAEQ
jgi:hypothetical protein